MIFWGTPYFTQMNRKNNHTLNIHIAAHTSMWSFAKQIRTKMILMGRENVDALQLYKKIRNAWFGYLSLIDADMQPLMSCPLPNCNIVQGDG